MFYTAKGLQYNGLFFSEKDINSIKNIAPSNSIDYFESLEDAIKNTENSKKYYAVKNGRINGIFLSWDDCKEQISHFPNAIYKSFIKLLDAVEYITQKNSFNSFNETDFNNKSNAETCFAYVDGSFNSQTHKYGYGVILSVGDKKYEFSGNGCEPDMCSMRNVAGEILGATRAIQEAIKMKLPEITIYYDYQGIENWATGAWKRNKNGTIAYYDFIQEASKRIIINFKKVKAHSGVELNEFVDRLAKDAIGIK